MNLEGSWHEKLALSVTHFSLPTSGPLNNTSTFDKLQTIFRRAGRACSELVAAARRRGGGLRTLGLRVRSGGGEGGARVGGREQNGERIRRVV